MRRVRSVSRNITPIISTAAFYALFYLISAIQFDASIAPRAVPFDFLLQLIVSYILYSLSKRLWVFVACLMPRYTDR